MKGVNHGNETTYLFSKDLRLCNLPEAEKGGSQSESFDVADMALAYRLVPWLERIPGTSG